MRPLLQVRLSAGYPGRPDVLRDVMFEIGEGEILGLMGESGSGKSTLALALLRLLEYKGGTTSGQAIFDNRGLQVLNARTGNIRLSFDDPQNREIHEHLVDISNSGFRAAYEYPALSPGQPIAFQHAAARGNARVIWTRIIRAKVESGFLAI